MALIADARTTGKVIAGAVFNGAELDALRASGSPLPIDEQQKKQFLDYMEENYDQVTLPSDIIGDQAVYLEPEMKVMLAVHESVPVSIELPQKATLEVVETEPTMKGQTASSSYKPAVLSNGVRTMVPPFVGTGTKIVVMTADGSYVERAKD